MYADNLALCGESEEDLRAMVECFVELCRKGVKVSADMRKVIVVNGEEGLECEVLVM